MKAVQTSTQDAKLQALLGSIEAESEEAVHARERGTFDAMATPFQDKILLFGAGLLGTIALEGLRRAGIEPVAFADNNQRLWGSRVEGVPVLSTDEAVSKYAGAACFVVTIYNGSAVRKQLRDRGCAAVAPFTPLFWKYAEVFVPDSGVELPHSLRGGFEDVRHCHALLHDDASRQEVVGQLAWRYWLDATGLPAPLDPSTLYFPLDLLAPSHDEVFVDGGSFDGQTIRSFLSVWKQRFRHIVAFEPDASNRRVLSASIRDMGISDHSTVLPYALSNVNGATSFSSTGTVTSRIGRGGGDVVECRRLDDIALPMPPTYIKMDIEGSEPDALKGMSQTLKRYRPVLALCTYHRGHHLWELPNLIHNIDPDYRIFLRRYAEESWEGICYAIPPERLIKE